MRRLAAWLRIALIDLRGGLGRFFILIACLALGVMAIGTVSSVRSAVETAIARDAGSILGGDLEVRAPRLDIAPEVLSALEALGSVNREVQLNSQARKEEQTAFLSLRGVGDAYPLVGAVTLLPGALPGNPAELLGERDGMMGLLLGPSAALRLGARPGDMVRIGTLDLQLRGLIDTMPDAATLGFQLGAPALVSDAALPLAGLQQEGMLSQFRYKVLLDDGDFTAAQTALQAQFPEADWQIRLPVSSGCSAISCCWWRSPPWWWAGWGRPMQSPPMWRSGRRALPRCGRSAPAASVSWCIFWRRSWCWRWGRP